MELVITVTFSAAPEQSLDVFENFQGSKLKAFQWNFWKYVLSENQLSLHMLLCCLKRNPFNVCYHIW